MKTFYRLLLVLILFSIASLLKSQTFHQVYYTPIDSVICNPERGFFHFSTGNSSGSYNYLNPNTLQGYRQQGITLLHRYYYIDAFKSSDISGEFLLGMKNDFEVLRQAGVKAVIRFAYCESMSKPYGDAPIDIVLRHIGQLKPLLQENSDVILALQAGFIGAWGEWYFTDYYALAPGVITPEYWDLRRQIVDALLDALPATRQVQVRTPLYKQHLLENDQPVSAEQAYSDLPIARIGHHNDCFVSSADDYGTYDDTLVEKAYLEADTRYTMIDGETCNPAPPYSDCPNSLHELRRFHWTCLNMDYNGTLLNGWRSQGCFPEVEKKLGYRYRMVSADIQDEARPGGQFEVKLKLINDGWSNPVNPRMAEIVVRNVITLKEFTYRLQEDPRFWPLGDTIFLDVKAGIPQNMEPGEYSVFFNMPDPELTLYSKPYFSIRMANLSAWDSGTGYNNLESSFMVADNAGLPAYGGTGFFFPRKPVIIETAAISIDGIADDWTTVPVIYTLNGQPATSLKVYNNADSLYFLVEGDGMQSDYQFFIDADNNAGTGYNAWQWKTNGSDYLIENGILYRHEGSAGEWNWVQIGPVDDAQNAGVIEAGAALEDFNDVNLEGLFSIAFVNDPQNLVQSSYLPESQSYFIPVTLLLPNPTQVKATVYGNTVVAYWPAGWDNSLYNVLERSQDGTNFEPVSILRNKVIAFTDEGLAENQDYQYRIYRTNGLYVSAASPSIEITTETAANFFIDIKLDGSMEDWYGIEPVATGFGTELEALRLANFGDSLYFSFEVSGDAANHTLFLDCDRNPETGLPNNLSIPGFDFKVGHDSLYAAAGQSWSFVRKVSGIGSGNFYEGALTMAELGIQDAGSIYVSARSQDVQLPETTPWAEFFKLPQPGVPLYFLLRNSELYPDTRFIIEWSPPGNCQGYIIERSVGDSSHFVNLVDLPLTATYYHDNTVHKDTAYYYRMYAYSAINRSAYTNILGGYPGQVTFGIGESAFNAATLKVYPNPVSGHAKVELWMRYPDKVTVSIFNINGQKIRQLYSGQASTYNYFDIEEGTLSPGIYFIRVNGNNINLAEKIAFY